MPLRPSVNEPDDYSFPSSFADRTGLTRNTSSEEVEPLHSRHNFDIQSRRRLSRGNTSHHEPLQQARPTTKEESDSEDGIDQEEYFEAYREKLSEQIRRDPLGLTLVPYADDGFAPLTTRAYPRQPPGRPLIDFIRNEWRHTISDSSVPGTPTCEQVITAPRFRRYFCTFSLLLIMFLINWIWWLGPILRENSALNRSISPARIRPGQGIFGSNMRAEFRDMIQLKNIDERLIPKKGARRRLIVIGDVHGCHEELVALLFKIGYDKHNDHIILAGDIISKGPSSPDVVDLAISISASCVRGNHEDRVLLARQNLQSSSLTYHQPNKPRTEETPDQEILRRAIAPSTTDAAGKSKKGNQRKQKKKHGSDDWDRYSPADVDLARSLSKDQINYLAACPVILNLGLIPPLGTVQVVHAGLVPGIRLQSQDPFSVMNMRTIDLDTHIPSPVYEGIPWYKLWERYQDHQMKMLKKKRKKMNKGDQPSTVIYGHDSRRGLQLRRWTKGLDTGCVKGGRLTALIMMGGDGKGKQTGRTKTETETETETEMETTKGEGVKLQVESVRCRDHRTEENRKNGQ